MRVLIRITMVHVHARRAYLPHMSRVFTAWRVRRSALPPGPPAQIAARMVKHCIFLTIKMAALDDLKTQAMAGVPSVTRFQSAAAMIAAAERLQSAASAEGNDEAAFVYNYRLAQFLLKVSTHPNLSGEQVDAVKVLTREATTALEVLKPRILSNRGLSPQPAAQ